MVERSTSDDCRPLASSRQSPRVSTWRLTRPAPRPPWSKFSPLPSRPWRLTRQSPTITPWGSRPLRRRAVAGPGIVEAIAAGGEAMVDQAGAADELVEARP
jgi:hypothetical protein